MSRVVELTFDGNSRGSVGAAKETVAAIDKVKAAAIQQAQQGIQKRLEERRSLQALATEYTRVATTAKKGSEQQVAAYKLEQQALRQLDEQHAVHSRRLQSSTKDIERFGKGALIGSGALGHLGRTAAIASGSFLGGVGVIEVFKHATNEGSSLATQVERTTKVFGEQAAGIKAWSKTSVDALGLARAETLGFSNDIGQLLVNMKLLPAQAAAMSKGLLQRAADVATEKNVPTGDVVGAFTAAINGQVRGLREYGIALDNVMVKRKAEQLGLVRNTVDLGKVHDATEQVRIAEYNLGKQIEKHGAQSAEAAKATIEVHKAQTLLTKAQNGHAETLTKAQRAQATYNAILEQTGNQQGYIAKHTDDLTVQERKLHAEQKQLFEILGTGLIPMLIKYLPHLTDWIDKNEKNGNFAREFNKAIKTGGEVVQAVIPVVKEAAKMWGQLSDALGGSDHAIELLGGLLVGKKLLGGLKGLGLAAGEKGAAGEVGLLASRLGGLGAISIAPIVIPIALAITDKEKGWITKHLGKAGAALFDGVMTIAGGGALGGFGAIKGDLTGGSGGGGTSADAGTTKGIVSTGKALGPSSGAIYERGGTGGTSGGHTVFDCSGYVYDVFTKNGFNGFPRTSEAQFNTVRGANWTSEPIALAGVQPGDVVFFNEGHDPPPGHVALIVSGSGLGASYIEYYQTGKPARTSTGFAGRNVSAAKRFYLVKNSSGHSNDPMSDAGGGNRTATPKPANDTTTGGNNDTTTFIEKPKPGKDPFKAIRVALKTGIAQINDDVDKGLLPKEVGDRLDARAQQIQKSLEHATKADIPKIRTQMKDLNAAVNAGLRATRDQALLGRDEKQIRTDVKDGLLSKAVGDSLIKQAQAINARLVKDIFDPKKSAADDAAAKGFRARIAAMLSQAAEVRTIDADMTKMRTDWGQQLDQALGIPVEHASEGAVAKAKAGIAKIRAVFAGPDAIPAAARTKLKQQLTAYEATVADGMQGVIDKVTLGRTKLETAWSRLSSAAFSAFDKETSRHLAKMQDDVKKAIDAIQVTVQGSGFASFLFGGPGAQTPTEKLLAQRAAAKQKADDINSIADATKALADAQAALAAYGGAMGGTAGAPGHDTITTASGDTVTGIGVGGTAGTDDLASLQQAVVDAQKALDDARYQQETDDLDAQAQLERDAADKQLTAAQDAAQKLADQQQQDYQDQRDAQRQHIQDLFDNELQAILEGKQTLGQAMAELGGVLGMNLASAFGSWFDPSNPNSVTATLAGFLYQVELAKGKTSSQAAVAALTSLPPGSFSFGAAPGTDYTQLPGAGTPRPSGKRFGDVLGFAGGGWADQGRPVIDPRDTIPSMLRRGEYVMSPEEVAAGRPRWSRDSGNGVGDVYLDGKKVGIHVARHVTDAQERQISFPSPRG